MDNFEQENLDQNLTELRSVIGQIEAPPFPKYKIHDLSPEPKIQRNFLPVWKGLFRYRYAGLSYVVVAVLAVSLGIQLISIDNAPKNEIVKRRTVPPAEFSTTRTYIPVRVSSISAGPQHYFFDSHIVRNNSGRIRAVYIPGLQEMKL